LKTKDFTENVNKGISENSEHLPERLCEVLVIDEVNVDKPKETYPVTEKMDVKIPTHLSDKELQGIEEVLTQTIANPLGCHPEPTSIQVTVDPKIGETPFVVKTNDKTLADETQKFLKTEDFTENVNKAISENFENLLGLDRQVLRFLRLSQ